MDAVRANASEEFVRFSLITWVSETGSTNADLLRAAHDGAPEQVVCADAQHSGRGRLGRVWESEPGSGLLWSVLVRPPFGWDSLAWLTQAMGVAVVGACRSLVPTADAGAIGLKWPNDVVVRSDTGDRKLAGVLAESVVRSGQVEAVVVGVGLNVNWTAVPEPLEGIATAVSLVAGRSVDRPTLLDDVLARFAAELDDPAGVPQRAQDLSATLGRDVRIETPDGFWEGTAVGLAEDGALLVDRGGVVRPVHAGDVVHLRPTSLGG